MQDVACFGRGGLERCGGDLGTTASTVLFDKVQTLDLTGQNEHTFSTEYSLWARDENAVETEDAADTGVLEVVIPRR